MDILFLAPHPFYQDRGSPIAVNNLLKEMPRQGYRVDVLVYHEGEDVSYDNVVVHRIPNIPLIRNVQPGFSWKKLVCDLFFSLKALSLVARRRYDLIHAVEEAVFIALLFRILIGVPYVYDMDSSLPEQIILKHPFLKPLLPLMRLCERFAINNAVALLAVFDALPHIDDRSKPVRTFVIRDFSLLGTEEQEEAEDLREELQICGPIMMYVGNLRYYQGIDLVLESFANLHPDAAHPASLVIIGGGEAAMVQYREMAVQLGIEQRVHFLGPRPITMLGSYLAQADILLSPRLVGTNTPMKVFSYLDSGKPVLATNLEMHTQVLDEKIALLVEPTVPSFSAGMQALLRDSALRLRLGKLGRERAQTFYSYSVYRRDVDRFFSILEAEVIGSTDGVAEPVSKPLIEKRQ